MIESRDASFGRHAAQHVVGVGVRVRRAHDKCLTDREKGSVGSLELFVSIGEQAAVRRGRVRSGYARRSARCRGRRASTRRRAAARAARWRVRWRRRARRARSPGGRARRRGPGTTPRERAAPPTSAISSIAWPVNASTGREQGPRGCARRLRRPRGPGRGGSSRATCSRSRRASRRCSAARSRPRARAGTCTPPAPATVARRRVVEGGERVVGAVVAELVVGVDDVAQHVLERPCRRARSRRTRRSARGTAPGIEKIWWSRSTRNVVDLVDEHAGRADRDAGPARSRTRRSRPRRSRCRSCPRTRSPTRAARARRRRRASSGPTAAVDRRRAAAAGWRRRRRAARARRRTRAGRACGCRTAGT